MGDSKLTLPVNVGEYCTIELSKTSNIFDNKKYFKDEFVEGKNIKVHNNKPEDNNKQFSICSLSDDKSIAYQNCAYKYNNPYLVNTIINNKSYCILPKNINPNNSRYKFNNSSNTSITSEIYNKNPIKNLCEERWHDWFCIPDYHLGNKYYNEVPDDLKNSKSVGTCYIPCQFNYVPRDDIGSMSKCILKSEFNGGIYSGTFNYIPLAMIYLFGMTQTLFLDSNLGYPKYIDNVYNNIILPDNSIKLNNKGTENIIDYINNPDSGITKDLWETIKSDISYNINKLHEIVPNIDNDFIDNVIIEPNESILRVSKNILTKERILSAYNIAKKIKDYLSNINENPLNTNYENYKGWKNDLMLTNPTLTKEQLKMQIKMFKKSVNICFNGKSSYSKNYILYTINSVDSPLEFNDIDFDPEDEEIVINKFNLKAKKEDNFFEIYKKDFDNVRKGIDIYMELLIYILFIMILYAVYLSYYSTIVSFINYIYISILWILYDIRGFLYYKILIYFYKYDANDTDLIKKEFVRNKYSNNVQRTKEYIENNF